MDSRHHVGTKPRKQVAVPMVRPSTHHQCVGQGTRSHAPKIGQTAHGSTCGSPRGTTMPAWMTAEQRGCVAVELRLRERPGTSGEEGTLPRGTPSPPELGGRACME